MHFQNFLCVGNLKIDVSTMNAFPKFPYIGKLKIDVSTMNAFPKFPLRWQP